MTGGPGILDLVHDSIIVRALDGTILQWNAAAEAHSSTRPSRRSRWNLPQTGSHLARS